MAIIIILSNYIQFVNIPIIQFSHIKVYDLFLKTLKIKSLIFYPICTLGALLFIPIKSLHQLLMITFSVITHKNIVSCSKK